MPFPGGIAGSGSKAGSKYPFMIASTYEKFCPTLRGQARARIGSCRRGVDSVMEIIINGRDLANRSSRPRKRRSRRPRNTPGLVRISAGNYGGRLGKSFIYLHPDKQPPVT